MTIYKQFETPPIHKSVVAMGIFDGVHLGHAALLKHLTQKAAMLHTQSVVVTFNHSHLPASANNIKRNHCLTTTAEKRELLRQAGIHTLVETELAGELETMEPEEFINNILYRKLDASHVILGYDQRFGKNAKGTFATLQQQAPHFGLTVEQTPELRPNGNRVSSSIIKHLLLNGDTHTANTLLGYNYKISGTVTGGKKKGRTIGFPTANIQPDTGKLVPRTGAYAVHVDTPSGRFGGMLNIGTNPTIDAENTKQTIEVNIFDFNTDIYGSEITVTFIEQLRNEKQFDSTEQLAAQLKLDKEKALKIVNTLLQYKI